LIADFCLWPHSSYQEILASGALAAQRETFVDWFGDRDNFEAFHRDLQGLQDLQGPQDLPDLDGFEDE
jgi:hypothetical protein